jgi:endo-1,4-beta-xylanase
MPRFGDVISDWDVVNEPIEPSDGREDGLRANPFLQAFGAGYVGRALTEARIFAPRGRLMINEYGLEYEIDAGRRRALLALLSRLKAEGVPLDGLGLQSHLDLRKGSISQPAISAFLRAVADLGLFVAITELDVKESDYVASARDRDRAVADEVRRYLDSVLSSAPVIGVSTWGITDQHSWLVVSEADYARFAGAWRRGDGPGLNRGLPYDAGMARKPMYETIAEALGARRPDAPRLRKSG